MYSFDFMPPENLGLTEPDYFYYLNQSGCYTVDGTSDKDEYNDTRVNIVIIIVYNFL